MEYTIKQLANLAKVSVRTLHYYDEIGLLRPAYVAKNGYRHYGEAELLRLQQILFFRELDFPLEEIKRIMSSIHMDNLSILEEQKKLLQFEKQRLEKLIHMITKTMTGLQKKQKLNDEELFGSFTKEEMEKYKEEAKQRWGHTEAWKQSQERTKHWTKADYDRLAADGDKFMRVVLATMDKGPTHPDVQKLIDQHYNALRTFYEPNLEMYKGLAEMYVADSRFAAFYKKYHPAMPEFMRDAMLHYVATQTHS